MTSLHYQSFHTNICEFSNWPLISNHWSNDLPVFYMLNVYNHGMKTSEVRCARSWKLAKSFLFYNSLIPPSFRTVRLKGKNYLTRRSHAASIAITSKSKKAMSTWWCWIFYEDERLSEERKIVLQKSWFTREAVPLVLIDMTKVKEKYNLVAFIFTELQRKAFWRGTKVIACMEYQWNQLANIYFFYVKTSLAWLLSKKYTQNVLQSVIGTRSVIGLFILSNALIFLKWPVITYLFILFLFC